MHDQRNDSSSTLTKYQRASPPTTLTHILKSVKLKNEGLIRMRVHGRQNQVQVQYPRPRVVFCEHIIYPDIFVEQLVSFLLQLLQRPKCESKQVLSYLAIYILQMLGFDFNVIRNMCRCNFIIGGKTLFIISNITHCGCIRHGLFTILVGFVFKTNFVCHLVVMKEDYGSSKQLYVHKSKPILKLDPILSLSTLDMQSSLFKLTM